HAALRACDSCLARRAQATELYQGELISGLSLPDAAPFEEWLLQSREQLSQQAMMNLATLSAAYEGRGEMSRALRLANDLLLLDPYREESNRQKMRLLAKTGAPNQALEHFEHLQRLLMQELGVEVDSATAALAEQIRHGE